MTFAEPLATGATDTFPVATVACALGLVLVPLVSGRLVSPRRERRRAWLSAAGGASVAYVLVLLLPEVSEVALEYGKARGDALLIEQAVYLAVLGGLLVFYGLEVFAAQHTSETEPSPLRFWIHLGSFAVYSAVIAYLLFHQEVPDLRNLLFYAVAMALHFAVTDYGLRRHYDQLYERFGRWMLSGATLFGAVLGLLVTLDVIVLSLLFGFVAGSLILNVVKEELPEASEGLFVPFVAGAVVYVVLILLS